MTAAELGPRALNRALLARQMLLERAAVSVPQALTHLVGLQAQNPNPPYTGLWTRVAGFRPEDLSALVLDRSVVRVALMRGTVHLVTADDCLDLRPIVQPLYDRDLAVTPARARALEGLDLGAVAAAARSVLAAGHRTPAELGTALAAALADRGPERDPAALTYAARSLLALVQVPPRGVWGAGGRTLYATAEDWLGRPLSADPAPDRLVLRYLAAFGPASAPDVQAWSGLPRLGEVVDRLRPDLVTFRSTAGRELVDLPDAPRPDPDVPAPVRFVPEFDNLVMAHADRTRVVSDDDRRAHLVTPNGMPPGTVLVDGFVRASWKLSRSGGAATLTVRPFRPLAKRATSSVTAEARRLLRALAPADTPTVTVAAPP
jgi:hypothetical protein